jgi:ubiquinone/menaquinone biosynthesis C-methylase UbiE
MTTNSEQNDQWRVWNVESSYGETLYKRATGELPEMESSKKMAKELRGVISDQDELLDVGCGAGHYLRSLRRELGSNFHYTGCDATAPYVDLARSAFSHDLNARFSVGDIFNLEFKDAAFDVVMCNNLLLHLPSVMKPIEELTRVARRAVFVRTLIGDRSFRIQDVYPDTPEFDERGEPTRFYFYNIYSEAYIGSLLRRIKRVKSWNIAPDFDFDKERIQSSVSDHGGARNASRVLGQYQVNGYILQPWAVLQITLE